MSTGCYVHPTAIPLQERDVAKMVWQGFNKVGVQPIPLSSSVISLLSIVPGKGLIGFEWLQLLNLNWGSQGITNSLPSRAPNLMIEIFTISNGGVQ